MKILLPFALSLSLVALGPASAHAQITARGSDSTLHVMKALAEAFEKDSGKSVKLEGGGSGPGAKAAIAGEVQLAFLSRALSSAEKDAGLSGVAYAIDGVAVIAHKDNVQSDISIAELKDLYTGASSNWKDGRPAVLFNRNADSGTREVFSELVLGKDGRFTDKAAVKHDALLVSSVSKIPSALAYTSLAEADEGVVKILTVNGIKPSTETLRAKTYPLARVPTLATKGEASGDAKAFIDFVLSAKGQAVVEEQKLVKIK
jgi:phosphate transport system substrate-binding protein